MLRVGPGPRWLRGFVVIQIVAILTAGVSIALKAKMLVGPDERAHVSYIQIIVDDHRLPEQDIDCVSEALHELQPASFFVPCSKEAGSSYEAFQPPLYYLVAAPVFAVVPGLANKVYALRIMDVVMLALGVAALWWLAFEVLGEDRIYGVALGLCAFAIPGLVVYQTVVSNDALEFPLAIAVLAACARATRMPHRRSPMILAAILFGAVVLTKLTSAYLFLPVGAAMIYRLWHDQTRARAVETLVAALIPMLMLAPWLALNEKRYHSLTADHLAHVEQLPTLNPRGIRLTWGQVPALDRTLTASYMPKMCGVPQPNQPGEPLRDPTAYVFLALMVLGPLVLISRKQSLVALFTLLPVGADLLFLDATYVLAQQKLDMARFLDPTLPPFALGLAVVVAGRQRQYIRWISYLSVAVFAGAFLFWITTALPTGFVCTQRIIN
jgi:hypothetical protein